MANPGVGPCQDFTSCGNTAKFPTIPTKYAIKSIVL